MLPGIALYCGGPIRVGHIPEPDAIVVWQDDPWFPPGISVDNLCCRLKSCLDQKAWHLMFRRFESLTRRKSLLPAQDNDRSMTHSVIVM